MPRRLARITTLALAALAPLALAAAALAPLALAPVAHAAAPWRPPVSGAVARGFDPGAHPFEAGRHRGVDLAAPPGSTVRAPCAGRVAFAGAVGTNGRVVTLRCGPWRVTHLPLGTITARPGATVEPGTRIGTVAASPEHRGLHLGVRREGERFGYADPLRFLATRPTHPPPLGPAPKPARRPRAGPPRLPTTRPPAPRTVPPPLRRPAPRLVAPASAPRGAPSIARRPAPGAPADSNPGAPPPFAPWPAWGGLALVLGGAGIRLRAKLPAIRERAAAPVR